MKTILPVGGLIVGVKVTVGVLVKVGTLVWEGISVIVGVREIVGVWVMVPVLVMVADCVKVIVRDGMRVCVGVSVFSRMSVPDGEGCSSWEGRKAAAFSVAVCSFPIPTASSPVNML